MAELIASGTTDLASADFTLASTSTTLYLKDAAGPTVPPFCSALVQIKSGTEYFTVGMIDTVNPAKVLGPASGTFRVLRIASANAFGVDRD